MRPISHIVVKRECTIQSHGIDGSHSELSYMAPGRHEYDGCFERGGKRYLRFHLTRMPQAISVVEERYLLTSSRKNKILYRKTV